MDRGNRLKRKPCPKENAGVLSILTFSYLVGFIHKGKKREIEEDDLYNVMNTFQSKKLGDRLERYWHKQKLNKGKTSIIKTLMSSYGTELIMLAATQIIVKIIYLYIMPMAFGKFVAYFQRNQTGSTRESAFYYAGILISITFLNGLWEQHFGLWKAEIGIKMQAAISSLLYRKALTLNQSKLSEISTGKIVTGIVKDVTTLNSAIMYGTDFILETLQLMLICILLYDRFGLGSVGGLVIMSLSMILQLAVSRIIYVRRGACNEKSDQRLQETKEILSSIRLIKMYHWETFFKDKLTKVRKTELVNLKYVLICKSISILLGTVSGRVAQLSVFTLCIYLGNNLNADSVYYIQQLFQKVASSMTFIPIGIQSIAEFMIAMRRIDFILNTEENDNILPKSPIQIIKPQINLVGVGVEFKNLKILKEVDLKLESGLNILIGPSGCGKSSLLKVILEEYCITDGKLRVQGTISYVSQHPWLFPSSLKQNILFGQTYDKKKYNTVLNMCGLTYDLNTFENGDETIITDCGANLSKGQQARINLARAIYRDSDIYLLDDSLASLDVQIKNKIFNEVISKYLRNKLCLLVTHSTEFINRADKAIVMSEGMVKYSGPPSDIPLELFQQIDQNVQDDVDEVTEAKENKTLIETEATCENSTLLSKEEQYGNIYTEKKKAGRVNFSSYKSYFAFGGGITMLFVLTSLHIICEFSSGVGDKLMSTWVNGQKVNAKLTSNDSISTTTSLPTIEFDEFNSSYNDEELRTKLSPTTTETWNNLPSAVPFSDTFTLYASSTLFLVIFVVVRCFLTYYYSIKVSRNLHKSMATNILQAFMTFFDTHLIGNILTRFSKDLFIVDEFIPYIWLEGFRLFFLLPTCLVLIASVNITLAFISIALTLIFFYLCDYILYTTRSTQRLSNSTLSPVIGHLNASLAGLAIIRSCGTQQILKDEFDKHQDLYISANHLREIAIRVLGLYSHTVASIFTAIIILGMLFFDTGILAGDVGLVISQSIKLCIFLEFGIVMWMRMENSMTSVERAIEYTKLSQENQGGRHLEQWPYEGGIKFQNVSLTYRANGETVLKNLDLNIHPQEKIGIVGRTGAGKSSIILTLFKMYDFSGDIMIDNVNIKTVSLECLRTNLAIIPQDPVIFTGSVRSNIDPEQKINDSQIWKILEVVNLKSCFKNLDEDITQKNLSIGQKQLICLARALTKRSKIVILDEATANMDEEMDSFIQSKIKELFQFCTVITVAHRLHTIRNSDRIIVMDRGRIVEFDSPHNLLNNPSGLYYKMLHQNNKESQNELEL